jgi:ketosteroid isomerase-like protein
MNATKLPIALGAALLLGACGGTNENGAVQVEAPDAQSAAVANLGGQLDVLERRADAIEDQSEIERLQRIYGYYLDQGDWDDSLDLMTDDVTVEIGASGVYEGKDHVRAFFYASAGGISGLRPEQLNDHIMLQPVIDIAPDGQTARGRWRLLGILGQYQQYARWQVGPYENEYRKENGVWKISAIHWADSFTVPFEGGLTTALDTSGEEAPALPDPDRPSTLDDRPWPALTELPFHFTSRSAGATAAAAREPVIAAAASGTDAALNRLRSRVAELSTAVERLEDEREIEIVQRTYGYYVDKNLWGQIADLFTDDGTLEIGGRGVFVGRDRALEYLEWLGEPEYGRLYDHTQIDGVVTVSPDGTTAKGRWRALVFGGNLGGVSVLGDCIYENEYRKEDGIWKLSKEHSYFIMYTNWDQGWAKLGWPNTRPEEELPPDLPPTVVYDMYPGKLTAPFHYDNPVTGPAPPPAAVDYARTSSWTADDLKREIAALETRIDRLTDADSIERLHNIYGYYFDAHDWDAVTDLFADDATIETGQRGVYVGRDHIRRSLDLFGAPGLRDGSYTASFQYQPVVHVAPDGLTAKMRARQMELGGTYGGGGIVGGGIYENEYVKQNGVWKIQAEHLYTTFTADYLKGWAEGALPIAGPSDELPPDRPPTEVYESFPAFYTLSFHYDNPVSGQPPVRK